MRKKNPFRVSFLCVAVICCVALSIVFFYINYMNNKATQERYAQEKAEQIMEELETQLQLMKEIAMRIASNYEFQPYYFYGDQVREMSMLESFRQYRYYTVLSEEYFLDYGGKWIYRSLGTSLDFEVFLKKKSKSEEERQRFRDEIAEVREGLTELCGEPRVLAVFDEIYVLIPLKVNGSELHNIAVLGFEVKKSTLEERFRIAGGGIEGGMTLYGEEGILYSNEVEPCSPEQKNVITAVSQNGLYTFCCHPQREYSMQGSLFFLQVLLVLFDVVLVFVISNIFAEKAYAPIQVLTENYRGKISKKKEPHENALEELKYMMDKMLQMNIESNLQIQENQKILREQVLQMIMSGSAYFEAQAYLDKVQIFLPGPWYCVISISFEEEEGVTKEFLNGLQEELEQISDVNENEYIYVISSKEKKLLNVICSVSTEAGKEELVETVCDVAESFAHEPMIGIGNTYRSLNNLSASFLESMDDIQNRKIRHEKEVHNGFVYNAEELHRMIEALESGTEEAALESLDCFVESLSKNTMSMLMLQYILADFLGEVRKLSGKYRLEVSRQNVSLIISAKNVQDFKMAAKNVIHEFCEGYKGIRSQVKEEESKKICEYIEAHFAEYDISIESVAASFHISTDAVRKAVLAHTGKLYREYLIYLRIEYAKVLLRQENVPVAELCKMVGYENVTYFTKLFKEVTGVPPARYRKNVVDKR